MNKLWYFSKIFWIGAVGFLGYGADALLNFIQTQQFFGCTARSSLAAFTFALVTWLRLKSNTALIKKRSELNNDENPL